MHSVSFGAFKVRLIMIPPWQVDRESVRVKVTREMDEDELIHILMLKGYTRKVCALIRVLCIGIDLWVALWPLC